MARGRRTRDGSVARTCGTGVVQNCTFALRFPRPRPPNCVGAGGLMADNGPPPLGRENSLARLDEKENTSRGKKAALPPRGAAKPALAAEDSETSLGCAAVRGWIWAAGGAPLPQTCARLGLLARCRVRGARSGGSPRAGTRTSLIAELERPLSPDAEPLQAPRSAQPERHARPVRVVAPRWGCPAPQGRLGVAGLSLAH